MHDNYDGTIQNYYTTTAIKDNGNIYDGCTTTLSPNLQSNANGKQYATQSYHAAEAPTVFSTFDYYRYNVPTQTENNIQQSSYKQMRFNSLNLQGNSDYNTNTLSGLLRQ